MDQMPTSIQWGLIVDTKNYMFYYYVRFKAKECCLQSNFSVPEFIFYIFADQCVATITKP